MVLASSVAMVGIASHSPLKASPFASLAHAHALAFSLCYLGEVRWVEMG